MQFSAPKETCLTASLSLISQKIENTVFLQRDHSNPTRIIVKIILPKINTHYEFKLFAKQITSEKEMYNCAAKFKLIRNCGTLQTDELFLKVYSTSLVYNICAPLDFNLKVNHVYTFKYYIKNVSQVALVDSKSKWYYLEEIDSESSLWSKDISVDAIGDFRLYAKPVESKNGSKFSGICLQNK
jgi:hypothetical protein